MVARRNATTMHNHPIMKAHVRSQDQKKTLTYRPRQKSFKCINESTQQTIAANLTKASFYSMVATRRQLDRNGKEQSSMEI